MHVKDIKNLKSFGNYSVDIRFGMLESTLADFIENEGLNLCPDFQRGHVWNREQQIKFVEFILRGGRTQPFLFNSPGWTNAAMSGEFVCVDGLQRITALRQFLNGSLPVFGHPIDQIEGIALPLKRIHFKLYINELKTRREVLEWYLELNAEGTPHTEAEINRVKELMEVYEQTQTR